MKPITEIQIPIPATRNLPTEEKGGLRYAIVFRDKYILALFDSLYWAKEFVNCTEIKETFKIVDVETGNTIT